MAQPHLESARTRPRIAIACGGTGGHLFPGLAVAEALEARGADTLLMVSPKEVDRQAIGGRPPADVAVLPAVALERDGLGRFLKGFWASLRASHAGFRARPPAAVLAMGGFTSAPPVLAGKWLGAATFLHEGNAVAGRANRWLAHVVDRAFVHFAEARGRLWPRDVLVTGMPVRAALTEADPAACRQALGLHPSRPVLLVVGGSQGAHGVNEAMSRLLPALALVEPELQYVHLTGPHDLDQIRLAYGRLQRRAVVRPFLTEMELALGAASAAISRAGASAIAEFAALQIPAILIPFPAAADNHQFFNARAVAQAGAGRLMPQAEATPEKLLWLVRELLRTESTRQTMKAALALWHRRDAADSIAEAILQGLHAHWRLPAAAASAGAAPSGLLALRPADTPPPS